MLARGGTSPSRPPLSPKLPMLAASLQLTVRRRLCAVCVMQAPSTLPRGKIGRLVSRAWQLLCTHRPVKTPTRRLISSPMRLAGYHCIFRGAVLGVCNIIGARSLPNCHMRSCLGTIACSHPCNPSDRYAERQKGQRDVPRAKLGRLLIGSTLLHAA